MKWDIFWEFHTLCQLETYVQSIFVRIFTRFRSHRPRSIFFIQYLCTELTNTQWTKIFKNDSFFEDFSPLCMRGPHHHIVNIRFDKGFSYYCQSCKYDYILSEHNKIKLLMNTMTFHFLMNGYYIFCFS